MSAAPTIPVENVYYLFCYAWNRFEEGQSIPLGAAPSPDLPNLLARVLLWGTRAILRRGLHRSYQIDEGEIATVRGRIHVGRTLRLQARKVRRLHCEFDELSYDVAHNRIIKASLKRLARAPRLDLELAQELRALAHRFPNVTDIRLERSAFSRIQLHRNNAYYDFLLRVAELAFDCLIPDPAGNGFLFQDVLRDEKKMARVFEEFVRNFYRIEQRGFSVEPLTIQWDAVSLTFGDVGRLPIMRADVFLSSQERRIIIDTKYYASSLQTYHGSDSFHSGNLYQIFSYLKNAAGRDPNFELAEGILLYPQVEHVLDARYWIQGHQVKVATVDLSRPWPVIADRLLKLLDRPSFARATSTEKNPR
jgi:5-methylcytosine-specific restriction enzyme subunit McrC